MELTLFSILLYGLTGVIAGIMAGMFGVGGGVIVIPGLLFAFKHAGFQPISLMHIAVGTSLAAMMFTTIASLYSHSNRKIVVWDIARQILPGILIGIVIGAVTAATLNGALLEKLFVIFLIYVGIRLFWDASKNKEPTPHINLAKEHLPHFWGFASFGVFVGFAAGMLGIGGGVLVIPFLMHWNVSLRHASGTSAVCAVAISIVGAFIFMLTGWGRPELPAWSTGYVYWPAALIVAMMSVGCVSIGSQLATWLPIQTLKRIFACLVFITAIEMLEI